MKRLFYVSRFARPLTSRDIDAIRISAVRYNHERGITGILICLGDMFFQALEGKPTVIDKLYNERILRDRRHRHVLCLNSINGLKNRMFPDWDMRIFNLNEDSEFCHWPSVRRWARFWSPIRSFHSILNRASFE